MVDWRRGAGSAFMKIIWCNGLPEIHAQLEGVHQPNIFSVMVFHGSIVNWRRRDSLSWQLLGVMVFQRSILNWLGVDLPYVYVHCAICETYLVYWFSRDICLIGWGGGVSLPWHSTTCETAFVYWSAMGICALCTMRDLWDVRVLHVSMVNWQGRCNGVAWTYGQLAGGKCNGVAWIYGQLVGGQYVMSTCAFCNMWNFLDLTV